MKITKVTITRYENKNVKGFSSITLDDSLVLTGMKIMDGSNGLWVSMPQIKVKEEYKDIYFPVTKEFREQIINAILKAYSKKLNDKKSVDTNESEDDLPF